MKLLATLALALLLALPARVEPADAPRVRPSVPDLALDRKAPGLQRGLEAAIEEAGAMELVRRGELAVALADLGAAGRVRYAGLNDDRMMYAASLPKIAALLTAFDRMAAGKLEPTPDLMRDLRRMIRYSDNAAATRVVREVGFEAIAECLGKPRYRLYDRDAGGGLWLGKAYDGAPAVARDPVGGFSHGATARQAVRFFALLDRGLLVSPAKSGEMKRILGRPGIHHKFVRGLRDRPESRIYRKSGTWRSWHADAALVERAGTEYAVSALVHHPEGGEVLARLIGLIDEAVRARGGS